MNVNEHLSEFSRHFTTWVVFFFLWLKSLCPFHHLTVVFLQEVWSSSTYHDCIYPLLDSHRSKLCSQSPHFFRIGENPPFVFSFKCFCLIQFEYNLWLIRIKCWIGWRHYKDIDKSTVSNYNNKTLLIPHGVSDCLYTLVVTHKFTRTYMNKYFLGRCVRVTKLELMGTLSIWGFKTCSRVTSAVLKKYRGTSATELELKTLQLPDQYLTGWSTVSLSVKLLLAYCR